MRTLLVFCIAILASGLSTATPKVILKLDDFQASNGSCLCLPTLDYLVQKQIKAAFGAVANRFDSTALDILKPYLKATNTKDEKLFEIWHHELDHKRPEFAGTSYDYFVANYNKLISRYPDYITLQGHPNQWTPDKLEQFKKIIDLLISEGCEFVLPIEYYKCNNFWR
jgi:hypothetical protein